MRRQKEARYRQFITLKGNQKSQNISQDGLHSSPSSRAHSPVPSVPLSLPLARQLITRPGSSATSIRAVWTSVQQVHRPVSQLPVGVHGELAPWTGPMRAAVSSAVQHLPRLWPWDLWQQGHIRNSLPPVSASSSARYKQAPPLPQWPPNSLGVGGEEKRARWHREDLFAL